MVVIAGFFGLIWGVWQSATKPLSGDMLPDLGQEHVTDITGIEYNSNPPTSGKHFPVWAKKGVYDRVLSDGYLIHSLEHGYIVVSYNCEKKVVSNQYSVIREASAHEGEEVLVATDSAEATDSAKPYAPLHKMMVSSPFTPENSPPVEVELPESFKTDECRQLVTGLSELIKVKDRVIIVPRPSLDTKIALTAWGQILKMDSLDLDKAKQFIRDFENRGPEKTME